ncbi:pectinesterase family protein [Streptomyces sp. NPDC093085]|uniref:pectinesterase family protein n=1 Tax=Streptomyces sp. NPDC093085 TaxID=3155068 RepID=UPI003418A590
MTDRQKQRRTHHHAHRRTRFRTGVAVSASALLALVAGAATAPAVAAGAPADTATSAITATTAVTEATGGRGGHVVTVRTAAELARYAGAAEPYIIRVAGPIEGAPPGTETVVASDKTVIGVGTAGEIAHGALRLRPGTRNVVLQNLTLGGGIRLDATVRQVRIDHNRLPRTDERPLRTAPADAQLTLTDNDFSIGATPGTRTGTGPGATHGTTPRPAENTGPQASLGTNTVLDVPRDYPTVQSAVDAVPAGNDGRITLAIAPGTYREQVRVVATKPLLEFRGTGGDRTRTVIVYDTPNEYGGSNGSATVLIAANDVTARDLTFVNDFDEEAHADLANKQALAMKTTGDRIVFENTGFLGNQDTLMTDSPQLTRISRVFIRDSYIEGDVDFIYGRATTVIERSLIRALSRGSDTNNGYVTAASTWKDNPYGILITGSRIVSDAPAGTFHLGRPWHPGGEPDAIGQVLIRETELPAAVKSAPWTDMSGFPWREARFAEYRTYGPGAAVTPDRPQMSDADAARHRVADYLAGQDGWAPHTARPTH